jgi:hypothetical protein
VIKILSIALISTIVLADIIETKECQYWDSFFKKCRYEKTIFTYKDISCTKECQHWKKTFKKCRYETNCEFDKKNKLFIKTSCQNWDDFFGRCDYEKKEIIKSSPKDDNKKQIIININ